MFCTFCETAYPTSEHFVRVTHVTEEISCPAA
jgi:hypothetical protein